MHLRARQPQRIGGLMKDLIGSLQWIEDGGSKLTLDSQEECTWQQRLQKSTQSSPI